MQMKVYGSHACPDTIYALAELRGQDIPMDYRDISGSMPYLREFLALRDAEPVFDEIKAKGGVGIPLFVLPDGSLTLSLAQALQAGQGKA